MINTDGHENNAIGNEARLIQALPSRGGEGSFVCSAQQSMLLLVRLLPTLVLKLLQVLSRSVSLCSTAPYPQSQQMMPNVRGAALIGSIS
jgi:hypothetical protein